MLYKVPVEQSPKHESMHLNKHPQIKLRLEKFLKMSAQQSLSIVNSDFCGNHQALPRKVPVRVEPKTYFANERTFLSWVNMSVTLGSISSALTVRLDMGWLRLVGSFKL